MAKRRLKGLVSLGEAPSEVSENIQAPETAPSDGRITGRTKPLSLKSTPEFHKELKQLAVEEECLMIEVLEKALECYKREKGELEKYVKIVSPKPKKIFFHPHQNFDCDKCGAGFQDETVYSYDTSLRKTTRTYCRRCIEDKRR